MIKSTVLLVVLILGIGVAVFLIQRATQLSSQAFSVADFVDFFHASVGESRFNADLDINDDGKINSLDVLQDRYAQESTNSAVESDTGNLDNILDSSDLGDASDSGSGI